MPTKQKESEKNRSLPADPKGILARVLAQSGESFFLYDFFGTACARIRHDKSTGRFVKNVPSDKDGSTSKELSQEQFLNVLRHTGWTLVSAHSSGAIKHKKCSVNTACEAISDSVSRSVEKARTFLDTYAHHRETVASESVHRARTGLLRAAAHISHSETLPDRKASLLSLMRSFPDYHRIKGLSQTDLKRKFPDTYTDFRLALTEYKQKLGKRMPRLDRKADCVRDIVVKIGLALSQTPYREK